MEPSGFFDDATEGAVRQFEDSVGIPADGLVARLTWQQLIVPVKRGQEGEAVRALQLLLANGLNVDGIPDVDTWRVLLAGAQDS